MPASQGPAQLPAWSQQPAAGGPANLYVTSPRTNTMAVLSLIFGILSWVLCPFVGAILAVIFGHVARGQIKQTGEAGGGMAMAGLVLGYVHLVASVVLFVVWIVVVGGLALFMSNLPAVSPTP